MIFRQLFERESSTYTYLLGDEASREAVLIDPVNTEIELYMRLLNELGLRLVVALDTHVHADHITALGELRKRTACTTMVGFSGEVDCASEGLEDGKIIKVGDIVIDVLYTPGHTDDSFSFLVNDNATKFLFSGDTLLIRGTGRTDFQNGDPAQLYASLHNKLLSLPDDTRVYPAHDYKGWTMSTIGEEKRTNPRLEPATEAAFIELMNNLNLPNPKMMDVAVPANRACGMQV
ncbi:Beta-lactamase hydrolase-like protein [Halioglobus japonicus]|nr:Beta-lactamase hydrolase-like protein [Halioglobus japonicus]